MKKQIFVAMGIFGLIFMIILNSDSAKTGAMAGWALCENIIVPSLLPLLILTNIIITSDCSIVLERLVGRFTGYAFGVKRSCTNAILLGLIAGYPAGAVLTNTLFSDGRIDSQTACRVMKYNFSGGIAFSIMVVGGVYYKSFKTGVLLYICGIISSVIIGLVSATGKRNSIDDEHNYSGKAFVDAMTDSVNISIKSLLNMCAYIILFSAVNAIFSLPDYAKPLLEITNGIFCSANHIPLEYTAFFLSFGGLCIHLQIMGVVSNFGMKYSQFLIGRLESALLSYFLMKLICIMFPKNIEVFSNSTLPAGIEFAQVNTGLSVIMILGCAVLVLDIESRKMKLI